MGATNGYDKHNTLSLFLKDYLQYTRATLTKDSFLGRAHYFRATAGRAQDAETCSAIEGIIAHINAEKTATPVPPSRKLLITSETNGTAHTTPPAHYKNGANGVKPPAEPDIDYSTMPIEQRFAIVMEAKVAGVVIGIGREKFLEQYSAFKRDGLLAYTKNPEQVPLFDIARLTFAYCGPRMVIATLRTMGLKGMTLEELDDELIALEQKVKKHLK